MGRFGNHSVHGNFCLLWSSPITAEPLCIFPSELARVHSGAKKLLAGVFLKWWSQSEGCWSCLSVNVSFQHKIGLSHQKENLSQGGDERSVFLYVCSWPSIDRVKGHSVLITYRAQPVLHTSTESYWTADGTGHFVHLIPQWRIKTKVWFLVMIFMVVSNQKVFFLLLFCFPALLLISYLFKSAVCHEGKP